MKFWFTKKSPKDAYDGKAPYDATVEQVLRVAQEVNAAPEETERETFDFAKAFRTKVEPVQPAAPAAADEQAPFALSRPTVSRAMRQEMERRIADYRAFQIKLNDEREARIRRTMDDVRAKLKQSAAQNPPLH
jgi:polyribonucleotide nucleotidyltransferase